MGKVRLPRYWAERGELGRGEAHAIVDIGLWVLDPLKRFLNPNLDRSIFIHGGYWKAKPVDPPGLNYNPTYGRSSNQEVLTGGPQTDIQPDDHVFLRPTQSEAVLMQFGDIAIYDKGTIVDMWSPFATSA